MTASGRSEPRALLAARTITAGFRGTPNVLQEASLQIRAGVRLAVMGANGSGKTTLLRCLSGAHEPAAGSVTRGGEPVTYRRSSLNEHRRHVQLVLQDPDDQLFSADVRADISFGPVNQGLPDVDVLARVEEVLALLHLQELADRPVHQLSYGQRKRVAIAGAVAMRPSVLLLDEPTAGLDPATVRLFRELLGHLERVGTTVVVATHDVDLAWRWADEVALVSDGAVVQGSVTDILTRDALIRQARLELPWQVELMRCTGLPLEPGSHPRTPADLAGILRRRG